jgi:hypothetical protein
LIRQMSIENVLWGAPRIQGELLRHVLCPKEIGRVGQRR